MSASGGNGCLAGHASAVEMVDSSDDDEPRTQRQVTRDLVPLRSAGGGLFGALSVVVGGTQSSKLPRPMSKLERQEAEERRMLQLDTKNHQAGAIRTGQPRSHPRAKSKALKHRARPSHRTSTSVADKSQRHSPRRSSPKELLEPTPFELRLKEAFDKMDTDGSGTLDKAELSAALRALGQGEAAVEALLAGITEPELSFEAFCKQMRNAMDGADSSDDEPGSQRRSGGGGLFGALSAMVVGGGLRGAMPRPLSKLERQEAEENSAREQVCVWTCVWTCAWTCVWTCAWTCVWT